MSSRPAAIDRAYRLLYAGHFRNFMREQQAGHFDECTIPSYARPGGLVSWLFWERIRAALSLAGDMSGTRVLDFGCGGGVLFSALDAAGCRIEACENQFYELAAGMAARLEVPVLLHRELEETEAVFDNIFALDVLEHLDDLGACLDLLRGRADQQTKIIVSGPTENLLYRAGRWLIGYQEQGRFHERTIFDVEADMRARGFVLQKCITLLPLVPLFRVSSWRIGL